MAGHSQFKNIMHRKGAQDARRAKVFTKVQREITVAAKSGLPDPSMNPRLRAAIQAARAVNMPQDNIARTIPRATGGGAGAEYKEIRNEGSGPDGTQVAAQEPHANHNPTEAETRATTRETE